MLSYDCKPSYKCKFKIFIKNNMSNLFCDFISIKTMSVKDKTIPRRNSNIM